MARLRSTVGLAAVLLVVGAVLTVFALSPLSYEAEALVFVSTTSDGNATPPAPDGSVLGAQIRAWFPASAAAAHQVQLVQEPDTYLFRVVAHDQQPAEAARRANLAAEDLVTAAGVHPVTTGSSTTRPTIASPAAPPPPQDRSPFTLGAVLAFTAAVALVSVRLVAGRSSARGRTSR
jgi:capsular polysaccharide biosynthesis protein